jgi:hypothetical protein
MVAAIGEHVTTALDDHTDTHGTGELIARTENVGISSTYRWRRTGPGLQAWHLALPNRRIYEIPQQPDPSACNTPGRFSSSHSN